jgi:hypothetical protein
MDGEVPALPLTALERDEKEYVSLRYGFYSYLPGEMVNPTRIAPHSSRAITHVSQGDDRHSMLAEVLSSAYAGLWKYERWILSGMALPVSDAAHVYVDKFRICSYAARGKELRRPAKLSHPDAVDGKVDGKTCHMEAPRRHVPPQPFQILIVLG